MEEKEKKSKQASKQASSSSRDPQLSLCFLPSSSPSIFYRPPPPLPPPPTPHDGPPSRSRPRWPGGPPCPPSGRPRGAARLGRGEQILSFDFSSFFLFLRPFVSVLDRGPKKADRRNGLSPSFSCLTPSQFQPWELHLMRSHRGGRWRER